MMAACGLARVLFLASAMMRAQEPVSIPGMQSVKLPAPLLRDGMSLADMGKALQEAAGGTALDRFLKGDLGSPFNLTVKAIDGAKAKEDSDRAQMVTLYFVAHGDLKKVPEMNVLTRLLSSGTSKMDILTDQAKDIREHYRRLELDLLKLVRITGVTRHRMTIRGKSAQLTFVLDQDREFPARWQPLDRDGRPGKSTPYTGLGGYAVITELPRPAGAVLVEMHVAMLEPREWFHGRDLLHSHLPLTVEKNVREFRQALQRPIREAKPPTTTQPVADFRRIPLERIPAGTLLGKKPPAGWSNLVVMITPTLTAEDLRDSPKLFAEYVRKFKFTILANVAQEHRSKVTYYLEKVARGFAVNIDGKETVITPKNTLNASLGLFGKRVLDENEAYVDDTVHQVLRTKTMMIFEALSILLRDGEHVKMNVRHAIVVDPETGRLRSLIWLLDKDYQPAEDVVRLLPVGLHHERVLSVKPEKFNALGIPTREAVGIRKLPQGTPLKYDDKLRWAATRKEFASQDVAEIERILRSAVMQAAAKE